MPFYRFKCPNCGVFEELLDMDEDLDECPKCGSKEIKKIFTTAKIHYNSPGFYSSTPYGSKPEGQS